MYGFVPAGFIFFSNYTNGDSEDNTPAVLCRIGFHAK